MSDGQWAPNSLVFVPDATDAFVPRTVVSCRGFGAEAQLVVAEKAGGSGVTVPKDAVGGVVEVDPMSLQGADDMVKFSNLNEAALLHNLRVRYGRDDIYSAAGSILISINPFKTVPIYTEERMRTCKARATLRRPSARVAILTRPNDDALVALGLFTSREVPLSVTPFFPFSQFTFLGCPVRRHS